MSKGIVLNGSQELIDTDVDVELSKKLDQSGFSLQQTVDEMKDLMDDSKDNGGAEALKVRLELIKHAQALHGSKASKTNINIGIFAHPNAGSKLNY